MKYTILSLETEEKLFETERAVSGVIIRGDQAEVAMGADREVFPLMRGSKSGEVRVATALGNISLIVTRGGLDESAGASSGKAKKVKSSMPGKVLRVMAKDGDAVEAGQPILVLEAMKMENEIRAPRAGTIEKIKIAEGQKVETGELLFILGAQA